MKEHVWYDTKHDEIRIINSHQHGAFGCWFLPEHGCVYLGEL
jgi:hypothetical protein